MRVAEGEEETTKKRCISAWIASSKILLEECKGSGVLTVPIEGSEFPVIVFAPNPSPDPGPEIPQEERIKVIEESAWAQNLAKGLCTKLFGLEPGTEEYERCVKRVAHKAAIGLIT